MTNHFLSKTKIPEELPSEMEKVVEELKSLPNQEQALTRAYEIMTQRFKGYHFKTYSKFPLIFAFDVNKLWSKSGFMHCHNMNYLLRILLVKSGHFENEDLRGKWTQVWFISPHQYLKVRMKTGKVIDVDVWGANQGIKFGDHAHGFN